jgi:hypothetical protein
MSENDLACSAYGDQLDPGTLDEYISQVFGRAYGTGRSHAHSPRLQHRPQLVGGIAPKPPFFTTQHSFYLYVVSSLLLSRENHGSHDPCGLRVWVIPGVGAGCEFVTRAKPTPAGKGRRGRRGFFLSLLNLRNFSVLRCRRLQVFLRRKVRCTDSCESPSCKSPPRARWPTQPTSFFMMAPLHCRYPEPPNFKTFQSLQTLELRPHILACPCRYFFLLTRSL